MMELNPLNLNTKRSSNILKFSLEKKEKRRGLHRMGKLGPDWPWPNPKRPLCRHFSFPLSWRTVDRGVLHAVYDRSTGDRQCRSSRECDLTTGIGADYDEACSRMF